MIIRRTLDATFLNAVANDPRVRPCLGGTGPIDLGVVLEAMGGLALVCDDGGFVLTPLSPGNLEVHSIFKPDHDGAPVKAMRAAMDWVFTRTDCVSIWSKVPKSNAAAKGLARVGGLRKVFERNHEMLGPTEFCNLSVMRWAMDAPEMAEHGKRFHDLIEGAKLDAGSSSPVHRHDESHERAVGAALLMFERGQPVKATGFYNTWAGCAGYQPLTLLSLSPVTVDTGEAIIGLGAGGLEVLKCR